MKVLYVLGEYANDFDIDADAIMQDWAQEKANSYKFSIVIESFLLNGKGKLVRCLLEFGKNQEPSVLSEVGKMSELRYLHDMRQSSGISVYNLDQCEAFDDHIREASISSIIVHVDMDLQEDSKATDPNLGLLLPLLKQLERLITSSHPITVLVLSVMGTGAFLHFEHRKVHAYGLWGCRETKLEVFDTAKKPDQTITSSQNCLRLNPEVKLYFPQERFMLKLKLEVKQSFPHDDSSTISSNPRKHLQEISDPYKEFEKATIYVICMKHSDTEEDWKIREYWMSTFKCLCKPSYEGELVLSYSCNLEEIPFFCRIIGPHDSVLQGVYTNKPFRPIFINGHVFKIENENLEAAGNNLELGTGGGMESYF